jgi:BlaI family penicillinase repressor
VGNIFQYYPAIAKEEYQKHAMKDVVSQYFDNSYSRMLAFFAKEQKLTEEELNDIIEIIKSNKK